MADVQRLRQIKIKTGVVKRLAKEKISYEKEVVKEQERIAKMKAENRDEYDIKKQEEVLRDSANMVPDCERRLQDSWDELNKLLDSETDLAESAEFKAAREALEESRVTAKR